MPFHDLRPGALALLLMLVLSGCLSMEQAATKQKRHQQLQSYDHTVRWGDLNEIYQYMKPEDRPPHPQEDLDRFRVTGYEVVMPAVELEEGRIERKVRIEYIERDRQVVRTLMDDQIWAYDQARGQWFRVNPPAVFK